MTRTQLQLPDSLYGQAKDYAAFREISMAEVFRNAIELYIRLHVVDETMPTRRNKWQPPVCRSTGLRQDPFADEDWREKLYLGRGEGEEDARNTRLLAPTFPSPSPRRR